jgi:cation diffusion facilitator CzcD-associated flavoprotein CzcO
MTAIATEIRNSTPEYHNVICIGAGVTSLSLVCQIQTMLGEKDFLLLERADAPGGTWQANSYPMAGCDIPIPLYSFSFAQKRNWSSFFALHDEIQSYLEEVADKFDVTRKCRFKTEVLTATWDEKLGLWHVYTRPATGTLERGGENKHYICKVLFSGVGGLSQPNPCTIAGHGSFQGPLFHSARWDHKVDMTGKNIFVIGNGCSATQFVPAIAKVAKSVKQAVRSKHWYAKRPADITNSKIWKWCLRYVPGFWRVQRMIIFVVLEASMLMMFKNKLGTLYRNHFANACIQYAKKTTPLRYHDAIIPKDGELQPGCKRRVFDTDYLTCLNRDNVDLVTSPVTEIRERSVVTKDGVEHPADVIVLANGFATLEMGFPMRIEGRGGITIQEYWKKHGGPQTYRGCMMSDFPNFFQGMAGNSGSGHHSYIFSAECQTRFAIRVMAPVLEAPRPFVFDSKSPQAKKSPSFSVTPEAERNELVWIQSKSQNMVYSFDCGSWYVDPASGRVAAMYPR